MVEIKFDFREKLDAMIGGEMHSYCYQCGACVGDCPAARYSDRFNPRMIMLKTIVGQIDELLSEDSPIWECTNCYNCSERCPQHVRPVEVIIALKNMIYEEGLDPIKVRKMVESVMETGITVSLTSATDRIREELGLSKVKPVSVDELKEII